jgi:hypothetical protein
VDCCEQGNEPSGYYKAGNFLTTRAIVKLSRGDTAVLSEDELVGRVPGTGSTGMQKRPSGNLQDIILETWKRRECNSKMRTRNVVDLCGVT